MLGLPFGRFDLHADGRLEYRLWPMHDELEPCADGSWLGRAYLGRWQYCTFRMVPRDR